MSLFQRPLQPPSVLSERAVERYLEAVRAELSVDPLFRRRLRGSLVNRFVADREGRTTARPRRQMGALGRAVLYATFALSVSVSSGMAASQGAAPGDALYGLKLQIEQLRLQALPEQLHDELAAHALGERIHELGLLAQREDWVRMTSHAAAVETAYTAYVMSFGAVDGALGSVDQQILVLESLLDRLPDPARRAISNVVAGVASTREKLTQGGGGASSSEGTNGQGGGSAPGGGGSDGGERGNGAGGAGGSSSGSGGGQGGPGNPGAGPSGGNDGGNDGKGNGPGKPAGNDDESAPRTPPTPRPAKSPKPGQDSSSPADTSGDAIPASADPDAGG
jgi:hypothetical protein